MADKFYSLSKGEQSPWQVTEGSSTSGEAIELRVNDSVWGDKTAVCLALEVLELFLQSQRETNPIA